MKPKALIIDDDEDLSTLMAKMLRDEGFETFCTMEGKSGIAKAHDWKPDIAIVDLLMPGLHGFTVCERLRADDTLQGMRILVASSKVYDNDKADALKVGADDYLVKPFRRQQLIDKVRALVPE
ncbi:MAG: response regulator transcription factor [Elusimicrobiota bacterium]